MHEPHLQHWLLFHGLLAVLLATEWLLLRRRTPARSYIATTLWLLGAAGFGAFLYFDLAPSFGTEFLAGYALEESLSIDNLFVFLLLFQSFSVEEKRQPKVLFLGILGAVLMRAGFIVLGVQLLARFEWVTYLFALLLLIASVRLVMPGKKTQGKPSWQRWLEKHASFSESQDGFLVRGERRAKADGAPAGADRHRLHRPPLRSRLHPRGALHHPAHVCRVHQQRDGRDGSAFSLLRACTCIAAAEIPALWISRRARLAAAKMLLQHWVEITALVSLIVIFALLALPIAISIAAQRRATR